MIAVTIIIIGRRQKQKKKMMRTKKKKKIRNGCKEIPATGRQSNRQPKIVYVITGQRQQRQDDGMLMGRGRRDWESMRRDNKEVILYTNHYDNSISGEREKGERIHIREWML